MQVFLDNDHFNAEKVLFAQVQVERTRKQEGNRLGDH